jgi:hypothetical protein
MEDGRGKPYRVQMEEGRWKREEETKNPKKLFRNTCRFFAKRRIASRKSRILYSSPGTVPP